MAGIPVGVIPAALERLIRGPPRLRYGDRADGPARSANTTSVIKSIQAMLITPKRAVEAVPKSHFGRVLTVVAPMVLQKGQGRAATVETEPLERCELIQPRKGQRDPEREPPPEAVLVPTKVIQQIPASMEKDINDKTRID